ncbi:NUDIX hydrolase, partial [Staphylococcus aureus]
MVEPDFASISSEALHTGAIFALRGDQVRIPGGGIVTREVVEHFGAVAIVAMDDNGNIPMVYQYRHT